MNKQVLRILEITGTVNNKTKMMTPNFRNVYTQPKCTSKYTNKYPRYEEVIDECDDEGAFVRHEA